MSVAARMSWASTRQTTRVEDEAYCLFGLFGINLPALYGEGRNAFYRLQEEIMRTSVDTSLFSWGIINPVNDEDIVRDCCDCPDDREHYLLASSPAEFCPSLKKSIRFHVRGPLSSNKRVSALLLDAVSIDSS